MNKLNRWVTGAAMACMVLISYKQAAAAADNPSVLTYKPNMTAASLAARPDSDIIQFKNGKRVSVGAFRRLDRVAKKLRKPRVNKRPAAFKFTPNASRIKLKMSTASDLKNALKLGDRETVQLPSGRLATAAEVKFAWRLVEKRLGLKLSSLLSRPDTSGPTLKIAPDTKKARWEAILQKPDKTVIESPSGKRITVGELKDYLRRHLTNEGRNQHKAVPEGKVPATAPRKPAAGRAK